MTENGTLIHTSTSDEMAKLLADEVESTNQLVKSLGLRRRRRDVAAAGCGQEGREARLREPAAGLVTLPARPLQRSSPAIRLMSST